KHRQMGVKRFIVARGHVHVQDGATEGLAPDRQSFACWEIVSREMHECETVPPSRHSMPPLPNCSSASAEVGTDCPAHGPFARAIAPGGARKSKFSARESNSCALKRRHCNSTACSDSPDSSHCCGAATATLQTRSVRPSPNTMREWTK